MGCACYIQYQYAYDAYTLASSTPVRTHVKRRKGGPGGTRGRRGRRGRKRESAAIKNAPLPPPRHNSTKDERERTSRATHGRRQPRGGVPPPPRKAEEGREVPGCGCGRGGVRPGRSRGGGVCCAAAARPRWSPRFRGVPPAGGGHRNRSWTRGDAPPGGRRRGRGEAQGHLRPLQSQGAGRRR